MKKLIILFAASFLLITTNINAQSIGFVGGLSLSKTKTTQNGTTLPGYGFEESYGFLVGHHIGVAFELPLSNNMFFETGLLYTSKGGKNDAKATSTDFLGNSYTIIEKEEVNLKYFEIPLLFRLKFDVGRFQVYGNFGPYASVGMSGTIDYEAEYNYNGDKQTITDKGEIKWLWEQGSRGLMRLDIGMAYGVGVSYNNFHLRGSFNDGLTNIAGNTDNNYGYSHSIKNRGFRISLGYMIEKSKEQEYVK